jgi:hypothetical protein
MNRLLLALILVCIGQTLSAQYIYTIKADSVKITNSCDTAELIIENHSQNVLGFLYNRGRGRTEFRRPGKLNDSTLVLGEDTIVINGSASANNGLSTSGSFAQLGQSPGASGNPAALINNREIPLNGFNMLYTGAGRIGFNNTNPAYGLHINRSVGILKDSLPLIRITNRFSPSFLVRSCLTIDTTTGLIQRMDFNDITNINTVLTYPRNVLNAPREMITNGFSFRIITMKGDSYLFIDSLNQVIGDYNAINSGMKMQISQKSKNIRIGNPNNSEIFLDDKVHDFSMLSLNAAGNSQDTFFNFKLTNGKVRFNRYGNGTHTGTPVKSALFTEKGEIIEGELPVTSIAAGNGITVNSSGGTHTVALNNILYDQGVYLPTATTGTNVTNITVDTAMFVRQQGFVSVSATVQITTNTDSTASSFDLSIPITSNFANTANLIGVVSNVSGTILANVANDRATVNFTSTTAGTETLTIEFRYRIL